MNENRKKIFAVLRPDGLAATNPLEVAERVRRLFEQHPETWGQGSMGTDVDGDPCSLASEHLCKVCLAGAALLTVQPSNSLKINAKGPAAGFLEKVAVGLEARDPVIVTDNHMPAIRFNDKATDVSQVKERVAQTEAALRKERSVRQRELLL